MSLLIGRDITVVRDQRRIVDGVTIELAEADVVTISGPSGCGKSTLLRALATLVPIAEGTISFEGRSVSEVGITAFRRRVAYVPQAPVMCEGSVADNIRIGPSFRGVALPNADVVALLERVGLDGALEGRPAAALSGGERMRVALARALANEPRVLLLDEPTAALDAASSKVVLDLLVDLARSGTSLLAVTHIEEHAAHLGGAVVHMKDGVIR